MKRIKYICKMGAHLRENRHSRSIQTHKQKQTQAAEAKKHTQATEDGRNTPADCIHDDGTGSPDGDDGWLAGEVLGGR